METLTVGDVLERAARIIDRRGYTSSEFESPWDSVCPFAAICIAFAGGGRFNYDMLVFWKRPRALSKTLRYFAAQLPRRRWTPFNIRIYAWASEVIGPQAAAKLRTCAAIWRAQHEVPAIDVWKVWCEDAGGGKGSAGLYPRPTKTDAPVTPVIAAHCADQRYSGAPAPSHQSVEEITA